jgi:hypothetical protein
MNFFLKVIQLLTTLMIPLIHLTTKTPVMTTTTKPLLVTATTKKKKLSVSSLRI